MSAHSKKKEETIVLTKTDPRAAAYVNLYAVLGACENLCRAGSGGESIAYKQKAS